MSDSKGVSRDEQGLGCGGIEILKDASRLLPAWVGETLSDGDPDRGWNAYRWAILEATSGRPRHIGVDKEYAFRRKIASLQKDAIVYRDHREAPGNLGLPSPGSSGSKAEAFREGSPEDFALEYGLISDSVNPVKSKPDWNPSHYNGLNRSTLIHDQDEPTGSDVDRDLPRRYFGRLHDVILTRFTQKINLKRVIFGPKSKGFLKNQRKTVTYEEGVRKAMWNVTPFDNPASLTLDQKDEHNGGPGKHGYKAHDYSTALATSTQSSGSGKYFQGGWMLDQVLDRASMIHDVLGVGNGRLDRYTARGGKKVSTTYIRHDAIFAQTQAALGRLHFKGVDTAEEPDGRKRWADLYLDIAKKGLDTKIDPTGVHETGQWRIIWLKPPVPICNCWTTTVPPVPSGDGGPPTAT